jgi:hypothetical protein
MGMMKKVKCARSLKQARRAFSKWRYAKKMYKNDFMDIGAGDDIFLRLLAVFSNTASKQ